MFNCWLSAKRLMLWLFISYSPYSLSTIALLLFIIKFVLLHIFTGADSFAKHDENVLFYPTEFVLEKLGRPEEIRRSSGSCCFSGGMMKSVWVCWPWVATFFFFLWIGDLLLDLSGDTFLFFCYFLLSFNTVIIESLKLSSTKISFKTYYSTWP